VSFIIEVPSDHPSMKHYSTAQSTPAPYSLSSSLRSKPINGNPSSPTSAQSPSGFKPYPESGSLLSTSLIHHVMIIYRSRIVALVTLLLFQSLSSSILQRYEQLIADHTVITLFLTMLVGAGGNAGNQAAVSAITGLATKEYSTRNIFKVLFRELIVAFLIASTLFVIGIGRVVLFYYGKEGTINIFGASNANEIMEPKIMVIASISMSLFIIAFISVLIGAILPFLFKMIKLDPQHAGPTIQVIMDIMGVFITCYISSILLS